MIKFLNLLVCVLFVAKAWCQDPGMGDCACICGLETNGGVISPSGISPAGSFLDRVRGPKGSAGRPGKQGPAGDEGAPGLRGPLGPPGTRAENSAQPLRSCLEYRTAHHEQSGMYTIKPTSTSSAIEVYCDMASSGGGWTLVASVHENNINGKCTAGDNWSSDQGRTNASYNGTGNWENFYVFGNPESATSDDYKSPAYYNLAASDVMIWHVPNDAEADQWSSQAFFKYYTDTGFLGNYGGTLQSLFSKHFPVRYLPPPPGTTYRGLTDVLEALNNSAAEIRSLIPGFYQYNYDFTGTQNHIGDGGLDMFDSGNKVFYQIGNGGYNQIVYRETYKDVTNQVEVSSSTAHPFIMLMWVDNSDRSIATFDIKVVSGTGADGSGSSTSYSGEMVYQSFTIHFEAYNVYGARDPSISEVFFYIQSTEVWESIPPTSFTRIEWSTATDNLEHITRVSGNPKSILMGYTLLSRGLGSRVEEQHVRSAVVRMLQTISSFGSITNHNCSRVAESLVVPVQYIQGSNEDVLTHLPPALSGSSEPGYIQFRALSADGIPNAICPGIRTETCKPSTVCIGGINTITKEANICGDFSGWAGLNNEVVSQDEPEGTAHSRNDISSSILIFTR